MKSLSHMVSAAALIVATSTFFLNSPPTAEAPPQAGIAPFVLPANLRPGVHLKNIAMPGKLMGSCEVLRVEGTWLQIRETSVPGKGDMIWLNGALILDCQILKPR